MPKFKIVADSSCDLRTLPDTGNILSYTTVPMKITILGKEFVDDIHLDIAELVDAFKHCKEKSHTACPSPGEWEAAFEDADEIFAITITHNLSGSYNSALCAKQNHLAKYPHKKIHIIDSLSTGPSMTLLVYRLQKLIQLGLPFEEICTKITTYYESTYLTFLLNHIDNLIHNGRVPKIAGMAINLLGIILVGRASTEGTLQPLHKCRSSAKAHKLMLQEMKDHGYCGKMVIIAHCLNPQEADVFRQLILTEFPNAPVHIMSTGGLDSYYAEDQSILVAYETTLD